MNKSLIILIESLRGGGAERNVLTLADTFVSMGHRCEIICFEAQCDFALPAGVPMTVLDLPARTRWGRATHSYYVRCARRLDAHLAEVQRQHGLDLVLSNLLQVDKIAVHSRFGPMYHVLRNTASARYVGNARGLSRALRLYRLRKLYNHRHVIGVSEGVRRDLLDTVGARPASSTTIYNPFNAERIRALAAQPLPLDVTDYLLHVGSFSAQKRHDRLLRAFADSGLACHLVLLGKGAGLAAVQQQARQLGIDRQVVFAGFQANPYPFMQHARLLVLCSDFEGLPTVLIEALLCGTPVLSTDCPSGPAEILRGELRQCLVPPDQPHMLADKMRQFYAAPPAVPACFADTFGADRIARQYLRLLERGTGGRAAGCPYHRSAPLLVVHFVLVS